MFWALRAANRRKMATSGYAPISAASLLYPDIFAYRIEEMALQMLQGCSFKIITPRLFALRASCTSASKSYFALVILHRPVGSPLIGPRLSV